MSIGVKASESSLAAAVNKKELKKVVIINDQPLFLAGIKSYVEVNLVGIEIVFAGSWFDYSTSKISLSEVFAILTSQNQTESEINSQISHFYEIETPILLMHDKDLDFSLNEILKLGPCVVVESHCTLDTFYTACLEIIENNTSWQSDEIKEKTKVVVKTKSTLSPREKESLILYASGLTLKEVANKLELSPNSVGKFISRGKDKLTKSGAAVGSKTGIYMELKKLNLMR
jgi:DNA-binding NarL/FixJ family response regulator